MNLNQADYKVLQWLAVGKRREFADLNEWKRETGVTPRMAERFDHERWIQVREVKDSSGKMWYGRNANGERFASCEPIEVCDWHSPNQQCASWDATFERPPLREETVQLFRSKQHSPVEVRLTGPGLGAVLEYEKQQAVETAAGGAAADDSAWIPARRCLDQTDIVTHKQLLAVLKQHQEIRWRRPPGRDGKPRSNRLEVHAGDWEKWKMDRDRQRDAARVADEMGEAVERRTATIRQQKQARGVRPSTSPSTSLLKNIPSQSPE